MQRFILRLSLAVAVIVIVMVSMAAPLAAAPVPSKTAASQTVAERQADLSTVREAVAIEGVAAALAAQGFTREQVETRIASLSNEDLQSLASNIEQVQAAGLTNEQWMWIGVGALAVLLLIVLL